MGTSHDGCAILEVQNEFMAHELVKNFGSAVATRELRRA